MASFKDLHFTPAEFSAMAKIDKSLVSELEASGMLTTTRKKMGNVERKMISLEDMQRYFHVLRQPHDGNLPEGVRIPAEATTIGAVAAATGMLPNVNTLGHPTKKTQMFYNVKGGTGKSTLTAQYVMRAAMSGYRVLAIDLDGQGHLTVNLDILDGHERATVYDVLINDLPMADAIMNVAPGLDLVPANLQLCNIEIPLNQKARREYRLGEAIRKIAHNYDLIVADTNPAASILNGSMLVASDLVNVVCATNPLSFHGMSLVMTTIEEMQREFSRELSVRIIPNMYDNREVISQEVLGELRSQFSEFCTKTVMNRSADINEATKRRSSVWDVNSKGVAAQDINSLTEELMFVDAPERFLDLPMEEAVEAPAEQATSAAPAAEIPAQQMDVSPAAADTAAATVEETPAMEPPAPQPAQPSVLI